MSRTALQVEYSQLASQYEERWRGYCDATHGRALECCPESGVGNCLDLGCGTGMLLQRLGARYPAARLFGVDASREMLSLARRKEIERTCLIEGDLTALPFSDGGFDLVVSSSVLHFVADWRKAVAECARVVRPGGQVVIADWWGRPWRMWLVDLWLRCVNAAHRSPIPEAELLREITSQGLVVVRRIRCHAGGPWWVHLLSATKRVGAGLPEGHGLNG